MKSKQEEVPCKYCNTLLGKLDEMGFTVCRGGIEVHFTGHGIISIRCYRPSCRSLNVLRLAPKPCQGEAAA